VLLCAILLYDIVCSVCICMDVSVLVVVRCCDVLATFFRLSMCLFLYVCICALYVLVLGWHSQRGAVSAVR